MKSIVQRDFRDCGVTCLLYIIEFYHGYVPIEKLKEDTYTDQNGTTAYHLVETLKKYQFDSFGEKSDMNHLKEIPLPAILHFVLPNGMQHFVVLTKIGEKSVTIMDPSSGKREVLKKELQTIWDGIVLVAIPRAYIPRIPKEKSVLKHVMEIVKREKKNIFVIVFFSFMISILSILSSFYLKIGMEYTPLFSSKQFWFFVGIFFGFTILKCIFTYSKGKMELKLNQNVEVTYLYSFVSHLLKLPSPKFQSFHEGDIITRIEEAKNVKDLFIQICITFFLEGILGISSLVLLLFLDYHLTLVVVLGMLLYCVISSLTSRYYYKIIKHLMENNTKWNEFIMEKIKLYPSMKNLNLTEYSIQTMEERLCETVVLNTKEKSHAFVIDFIRENFLEILFFLLMTYGMILVKDNTLTIYDFLLFQSLYLYFINPLKELTDLLPRFYYMKGILSKLSETMELKEEDVKSVSIIPVPSIEGKHISYSYNDVKESIVDFSFKVKAKEHVFLDGPSGCGKSTLCKILHRELTDYMGKITFLEKDLEDYTLSEIRSSVIYLSQNESFVAGTIEDNILMGSEKGKHFDEVCRACEIESIVSKKPLRYASFINDSTLSGGERQRVLLARALMKEGSVYLLDEVLSEVEDSMEVRIIEGIRKILKGKTVIYISHKDHSDLFERKITFANKKSTV